MKKFSIAILFSIGLLTASFAFAGQRSDRHGDKPSVSIKIPFSGDLANHHHRTRKPEHRPIHPSRHENRHGPRLCRGKFLGRMHTGKLINGRCYVTWRGHTTRLMNYRVIA